MKNAREAALAALYEIEYEGAYSNIALKNVLAKSELDSRDRALAVALVYGVISKKRTLDYMISQLSKIKLKKLSKYILLIVRMGLYQLKFMDKIPDNAAVNESVRLARRFGHSASSGYVNGLLRNAARRDIKLPDDVSIIESFAEENANRLISDYGDSAAELMSSLNKEPVTTLRANRLKTSAAALAEKLGGAVSPYLDDAVYVKQLDVSSSAEYEDGLFTVQDIAPMVACRVLAPSAGDRIIDLCAAPGGKTTYIAELMGNKGEILAFDIHEHRVELIDKNAKRLGIDIIKTALMDATKYNEELLESADKIIADVPCSGLGIARRKPELKYKTDNDTLFDIQLAILKNGAKYLKKNGEMVYSTCTLYKRENEEVIEAFLKRHKDFELVSFSELLPTGFCEDKAGIMTVLPNKTDCDGFFISKLRRS